MPTSALLSALPAVAAAAPAVTPHWSALLPPLVAIAMALISRQVLPSLFVAVLLGAALVEGGDPVAAFARTTSKYFVDAVADPDHAAIMIFSLALAGCVGVMSRSGGSQGIVDVMAPRARTPRRAQLATWFMGLIIFFDDYANTLLVGTTMRPLMDRFRISREKLAFVVDATAAPVAGVAAISTWIGFEVGLIQDAFHQAGIAQDAYLTFLQTIPSRFYSIFCLVMVFMICASGRDWGPMLQAELAARRGEGTVDDDEGPKMDPALAADPSKPRHWVMAVVPILFIFLGTGIGLWLDGSANLPEAMRGRSRAMAVAEATLAGDLPGVDAVDEATRSARIEAWVEAREAELEARYQKDLAAAGAKDVISSASTSRVLLFVSFLASILAIALPLGRGVASLSELLAAWEAGAKSLLPAYLILVLAWSLGDACKELGTAQVIAEVFGAHIAPPLLPALTFLAASGIAFATGSSWGTMSILMPLAIPLALKLVGPAAATGGAGAPVLIGTISAILAGSCFGDHCSPISDTTILSSMASGCDHIAHVRTQMPYALAAGGVSVFLGHIPAGYGVPTWVCLLLGAGALAGLIWGVGRIPEEVLAEQEAAPQETEESTSEEPDSGSAG